MNEVGESSIFMTRAAPGRPFESGIRRLRLAALLPLTTAPMRLGRYEILGPLGSGGMAEILLARQSGASGFSRVVAIKRMRRELLSSEESKRLFVHEVGIAARLRHPNVVTVHDVSEQTGEVFVVLEYLEGETVSSLRDVLTKHHGEPDPYLAAHIVAEACSGLHAAHELVDAEGRNMELVHRDVSPSNLFVTMDGHVKVLDFGIAKTTERSTVTELGNVRGKLAYMSPEQYAGIGIDRRADVFSLGVVLYELCTGTRLFLRSDPIATAEAVCHGPIARPTSFSACPMALEEIVLRALERKASRRYPTAIAMRSDLLKFMSRSPALMPEMVLADLMQASFGEAVSARRAMIAAPIAGGAGRAAHARRQDDVATADEPRATAPSKEPAVEETLPTERYPVEAPATPATPLSSLRRIGRYALLGPLASGGIGQVYWGCVLGIGGFSRIVAMKRMHPWLADGRDLTAMLLDEARLASRIQHPHVVRTVDVVASGADTFLVMDYVEGETIGHLLRHGPIPVDVAIAIAAGFLRGLHAAHQAVDSDDQPLGIVHRDVSPQNVLVGTDGLARVLDFGVAKARARLQETTQSGRIKGRLAYMAPEQLIGGEVTPATDVFASAIVLWECLTGRGTESALATSAARPAAGELVPGLPAELDAILSKAIREHPSDRYATAEAFADALDQLGVGATPRRVAHWLEAVAGPTLKDRRAAAASAERSAIASLGASGETAPSEVAPRALRRIEVHADASPPSAVEGVRRSSSLVGVGLALAALLVGVLFWIQREVAPPLVGEPLERAATSTVTAATDPSMMTQTTASAPTPAMESVLPARSGVASVSPPAKSPNVRAASVAATSKSVPRAVTVNCKPPYTVDEFKVKHPKPECRNAQ